MHYYIINHHHHQQPVVTTRSNQKIIKIAILRVIRKRCIEAFEHGLCKKCLLRNGYKFNGEVKQQYLELAAE